MIRAASTFAEWEERAQIPVREPVYLPARPELLSWKQASMIGTKVTLRILVYFCTLSLWRLS
jgi:hypothetical protein